MRHRTWSGLARLAFVLTVSALVPRVAWTQPLPFDSVLQGLKSADARIRLDSIRLLREAGYPEAAVPLAVLMADPVPQLQFEAVQADLSLFLVEKIPSRRRVGGVIEIRNAAIAEQAFSNGLMATLAEPVPPAVVRGLVAAMSSLEPRVRAEATYALGALVRTALPRADAELTKVILDALVLRLADPAQEVRLAAARVASRVGAFCGAACRAAGLDVLGDALVGSLNDKTPLTRLAAMEALGTLRYDRGVKALSDLFAYYGAGVEARAALLSLAQIGHSSSVPLFEAHLANPDETLRRAAVEGAGRAGDKTARQTIQDALATERSAAVAVAMAFSLHHLGGGPQVDRIVGALDDARTREQARNYLIELGAPAAAGLARFLTVTSLETRVQVAQVLGLTGTRAQIPALQALGADRDPKVSAAARWAVESIQGRTGTGS